MPGGHEEDLKLAQLCRRGSRDAFKSIVLKYQDKVFKQCYYHLDRNRQLAEDATQDIFIKAFQNIGGYKDESKLSTWLYSIAGNHCENIRKKEKRYLRVVGSDGILRGPDPGTENSVDESSVDAECVRQVLKSLGSKYRKVIEKVHFEELTYAEAAEALGCPAGTVGTRLNRALQRAAPLLRRCLKN